MYCKASFQRSTYDNDLTEPIYLVFVSELPLSDSTSASFPLRPFHHPVCDHFPYILYTVSNQKLDGWKAQQSDLTFAKLAWKQSLGSQLSIFSATNKNNKNVTNIMDHVGIRHTQTESLMHPGM